MREKIGRQQAPFAIDAGGGVAGGRVQTVVAADARAIACLDALRGLAAAWHQFRR